MPLDPSFLIIIIIPILNKYYQIDYSMYIVLGNGKYIAWISEESYYINPASFNAK